MKSVRFLKVAIHEGSSHLCEYGADQHGDDASGARARGSGASPCLARSYAPIVLGGAGYSIYPREVLSYCSTASIQGRTIRCRPPRLVVEAMATIARAGFRRFYFVDNSFNIPEAQAMGLCREIKKRKLGLEWRCILYPHLVGEELVKSMADAGCVEASMGFESGSPEVLREMNKRFSPDDVRRTSDMLANYNIRRMGFLLLGGPGETRETVEESLAFAESLGMDEMKATVGIRIYPGTPLARRAVAEGIITSEDQLLRPTFYLAKGLDPWIYERVAALAATAKN